MPRDPSNESEEDIKPTSSPPEGIEIPEDETFGGSEQLPPVDGDFEVDEPEAPEKKPQEKAQKPQKNSPEKKSIKINALALLIIVSIIAGAGFMVGRESKPTVIQEVEAPQPTQTSRRSNLILDQGLYRRENATRMVDLLSARLEMAKQGVFHVTDYPNDPAVAAALVRTQKRSGIPVRVLTGGETSQEQIKKAQELGLQVIQFQTTLERPYGITLIDNKLVVDTSRANWAWESAESEIIQSTRKWLETLINDVK